MPRQQQRSALGETNTNKLGLVPPADPSLQTLLQPDAGTPSEAADKNFKVRVLVPAGELTENLTGMTAASAMEYIETVVLVKGLTLTNRRGNRVWYPAHTIQEVELVRQ